MNASVVVMGVLARFIHAGPVELCSGMLVGGTHD
jgi:hypothetical protein